MLDSTDAGAVRAASATSTSNDDLRRLLEVRRDDRDDQRASSTSGTCTGADGSRFVAVTDPGSSLEALAEEHGFRRAFLNDPDIGGRYSALSYFGLVPAALMGADIAALLDGAQRRGRGAATRPTAPRTTAGCGSGSRSASWRSQGRDKLTFVVDPPIASFGLWVEQLVAESTGKHGKGIVPVADEPVGAPEAYGDDRVFVHLATATSPATHDAAVEALRKAGQPSCTLATDGPEDLGRILFFASSPPRSRAGCCEINPFDQPNVQAAKDKTERGPGRRRRRTIRRAPTDALAELLGDVGPAVLPGDPGLPGADATSSTGRSPSCARRSATRRR